MKLVHSCLALASLVTLSGSALAQDLSGAFQLGLGTGLITYNHATIEYELPVVGDVEYENSRTSWGFHQRGGVLLEGGYGLSDSLVLGGLLALGGDSNTIEDDGNDETTVSSFDLMLAPKVDYHFMQGPLRPFVGGALGLVVQNGEVEDATDTSLWGVGMLARAGLRWFAAPGFSVDPALNFGGQFLWGETETGNNDYDTNSSGFLIGLSLGVSGWIK
jgi:hypothetical protein